MLVAAHRYPPPLPALERIEQEIDAPPVVLADIRPPLWWGFGAVAEDALGATMTARLVGLEIERSLRFALRRVPRLAHGRFEATAGPLPTEIARRLHNGDFHRVLLIARPGDRWIVRRITRTHRRERACGPPLDLTRGGPFETIMSGSVPGAECAVGRSRPSPTRHACSGRLDMR